MTIADATTRERLRAGLPDVPRWMETRWMLGLKSTEVTGLDGGAPSSGGSADPISALIGMILAPGGGRAAAEGGFVVRDPPSGFISVVGKPSIEAIQDAVAANERLSDVVSQPENAEHVKAALPPWKRTRAKLHWLADAEKLFGRSGPRADALGLPANDDEVAFDIVRPEFISDAEVQAAKGLPEELRGELSLALLRGPVVGVKVAGKGHVSFCHAEVQTETLWDVSIDTLEEHRRQGYAEQAVSHLAKHMLDERKKRPIWGALETNEASLRLAAKLGFRPVDEMVVFERD